MLADPESARAMIGSAMLPSPAAGLGPVDSIPPSSPSSTTSSAASATSLASGAFRWQPSRWAATWRRSPLRPRDHLRAIGTRRGNIDPDSASRNVRNLSRLGIGSGSFRRRARSAAAQVNCDISKASSPSRAPAANAGVRARSSPSRAQHATAQGPSRRMRKLTVKIPAGIATGQRLRLSGEGEAAPKAALPAISTSSFRSGNIRSSIAMGTISRVRFR